MLQSVAGFLSIILILKRPMPHSVAVRMPMPHSEDADAIPQYSLAGILKR